MVARGAGCTYHSKELILSCHMPQPDARFFLPNASFRGFQLDTGIETDLSDTGPEPVTGYPLPSSPQGKTLRIETTLAAQVLDELKRRVDT